MNYGQIVYEKFNPFQYHVTFKQTGKVKVVTAKNLARVLNVQPDIALGCCPVSLNELHELGFTDVPVNSLDKTISMGKALWAVDREAMEAGRFIGTEIINDITLFEGGMGV